MANREDFLLKMYDACWANVTRAEDAIWKVFASYTAVFAGLAVAEKVIGFFGFITLIVAFSFIGMCISINANLWFVRNMGLISNIEKEFLSNDDFDKIIPKKWIKSKASFKNKEIWWIIFWLFPIVIVASTVVIFQELTTNEQCIIVLSEIIGFAIIGWYVKKSKKTHKDFLNDAPGKDIDENSNNQ